MQEKKRTIEINSLFFVYYLKKLKNIMKMNAASSVVIISLLLWSTTIADVDGDPLPQIFNVNRYGAKGDGHTDDSQAFLRAWNDACAWSKGYLSRLWVPRGTYKLSSVMFAGPCHSKVSFAIEGTLAAPTFPQQFLNLGTWIGFRNVDGLSVEGGGVLDGQGASAWKYNDCTKNPNCKLLPATLGFDFITNSVIRHIRSINSKNSHISLFSSANVNITSVTLTAPADSPNTDGIRMGNSTNIKISWANIETGDDCISMVSGTKTVDISNVQCGPGHGISIGSLGKDQSYEQVLGINVVSSNFSNTLNGVRIKTFSSSFPGMVSGVIFRDLTMNNVNNPIFIDQDYCPTCRTGGGGPSISKVQIDNVTYSDIQGTSSSKVAVSFQCSKVVPCQNVKLANINLEYNGPGGPATASCVNVHGYAQGKQAPPSCL